MGVAADSLGNMPHYLRLEAWEEGRAVSWWEMQRWGHGSSGACDVTVKL